MVFPRFASMKRSNATPKAFGVSERFHVSLSEDEWKNLRYQISTSSSGREHQSLRYQIGTSSLGHGGRRSRPYVFTEHGAIMAANVLNSPRAVQMNTTCGDAVGWTALVAW